MRNFVVMLKLAGYAIALHFISAPRLRRAITARVKALA